MVNAGRQAVLSTEAFSGFSGGIWASWNITGMCGFRWRARLAQNGVVNGIFFWRAG